MKNQAVTERCCWKFCKIYRKTSVLESFFKWSCGSEDCNLIKKRLRYRGFPVNFAKFSRAPLLKQTSRRLLLEMTQESLWHFGEVLCEMYLFKQTQALYNLLLCEAHSIIAKVLQKVPQNVIASQCDCYKTKFHIFFK